MEVISHKTIGECIAHWKYVFLVQTKKVVIVALFKKNVFPVVASVEDMEVSARFQKNVA
jgi:hypothetical protein